MSERKAINKYYPPDFDPSKIQKKRVPNKGNSTLSVRLMAPFSMRCVSCDEYIAKSKKFNAKKMTLPETYLDTKIYRFYIRCPRCNNEISFKTNPKNADFVVELGAVKNYDSKQVNYKVETQDEILERLEREDKEEQDYKQLQEKRKKDPLFQIQGNIRDEDGDILENLEKRLLEQQKEQQIEEELEMLQQRNATIENRGKQFLTSKIKDQLDGDEKLLQEQWEREDEELTRNAFQNFKSVGYIPKAMIASEDSEPITPKSSNESNEIITDLKPSVIVKRIKTKLFKPTIITGPKSTSLVDYASSSDSE